MKEIDVNQIATQGLLIASLFFNSIGASLIINRVIGYGLAFAIVGVILSISCFIYVLNTSGLQTAVGTAVLVLLTQLLVCIVEWIRAR